ncbi:MAG: GTP-binding protein, partial [Alphaproteobacteria bacterium]
MLESEEGYSLTARVDEVAIPLNVLTGFLGSGKTTLLARILANPAFADTAVLINELGEVGLDHLLVERLEEDIVLLDSGCVCCAIGDDLIAAVTRLMAARAYGAVPDFKRIVLETTGIADPGPIVQAVAARAGAVVPGAVVTVVDALLGAQSLDAYPECVHQVAMADRIVLSKTDLAVGEQVARLKARLADLAAGVPIVPQGQAAADPACLFARVGGGSGLAAAAAGQRQAHGYR